MCARNHIQSDKIVLTEDRHGLCRVDIVGDNRGRVSGNDSVRQYLRLEIHNSLPIYIDILEQCRVVVNVNKVDEICVRASSLRYYGDLGLSCSIWCADGHLLSLLFVHGNGRTLISLERNGVLKRIFVKSY